MSIWAAAGSIATAKVKSLIDRPSEKERHYARLLEGTDADTIGEATRLGLRHEGLPALVAAGGGYRPSGEWIGLAEWARAGLAKGGPGSATLKSILARAEAPTAIDQVTTALDVPGTSPAARMLGLDFGTIVMIGIALVALLFVVKK
jgi:hypothetical protein